VPTIAIYHLSIKIISCGKGKSAVAAAAYRAGETVTNEYDGVTHDYTRKDGIVHTEILLPDHAPAEYAARLSRTEDGVRNPYRTENGKSRQPIGTSVNARRIGAKRGRRIATARFALKEN